MHALHACSTGYIYIYIYICFWGVCACRQTRMLSRALDVGASGGIFLSSLCFCLTTLRQNKFYLSLLLSACILDPSLPLKVLRQSLPEAPQLIEGPPMGAPPAGKPRSGPPGGPPGGPSGGPPWGPQGTATNYGEGIAVRWPRTREEVLERVLDKLNGVDFGWVSACMHACMHACRRACSSVCMCACMYGCMRCGAASAGEALSAGITLHDGCMLACMQGLGFNV